MAYENIKTEMHGPRGRWCPRADAKQAAKRQRRADDKRAAQEGVCDGSEEGEGTSTEATTTTTTTAAGRAEPGGAGMGR